MFYESGQQIDEIYGDLTKSGSAVTKTISIPCYEGYEISCTTIADFAVECKQSGEVSYTDIETTPLSVDTWAGTTQDFNFRFTPGAVVGTFQPTIIYAPA